MGVLGRLTPLAIDDDLQEMSDGVENVAGITVSLPMISSLGDEFYFERTNGKKECDDLVAEIKVPVHWYVVVPKAGLSNFERALQFRTWGAKERSHFKDPAVGEIQPGDIIHFLCRIGWAGEGPTPKGFPRVPLEQFMVETRETTVRASSELFGSKEEIWPNQLYPHRFRFDILRQEQNARLVPEEVPDDVRDAARRSIISQGRAIAVRPLEGSLAQAIFDVLQQYPEAKRQPFPDHRVASIVKQVIPQGIQQWGILDEGRHRLVASVGQGNWAAVPWVAILDASRGGTMQDGLYVALLFVEDMDRVVLALMYGVMEAGGRVALAERVDSLRQRLQFDQTLWKVGDVRIAGRGAGAKYGQGIVVYREFLPDAIPSDAALRAAFARIVKIYDQALTVADKGWRARPSDANASTTRALEVPPSYASRSFDLMEASAMISDIGYHISTENLLNVILAIETRPFIILSGRSGTGKTTFTRILAKMFGLPYYRVAVSPAWADPADLLGFMSPLNHQRVPGALDSLVASTHASALLCLDEFNVAKVEHYFSDFISAMDAGEGQFWGSLPSLERLDGGMLTLPRRLLVIATMNFDDSVQSITPRVLDRANVIEFDLAAVQDLVVSRPLDWHKLETIEPRPWPWASAAPMADDELSVQLIQRLWMSLKGSRGQFGHRVAQEIYRYIQLGLPYAESLSKNTESQRMALLDRQIVQRLLPKFHGSAMATDIEAMVRALADFMDHNGDPVDVESRQTIVQAARNLGILPFTVTKIDRMLGTYTEDGYASYW